MNQQNLGNMNQENPWTRRQFLITTGMAAAAASLPLGSLRAQAMYTRYNVESTEGQQMLEGYKNALKHLLALPPDDPQNWYRLTLTHTLDCPHGNWWFLPWHRGYIGYTEQIIRKYSGNSNFAFPYWDWTANPEVPASFFGSDNPLDPTSSFYISTFAEFQTQFEGPIDDFYAALSQAQLTELQARDLDTPEKLWAAIDPANGGYFYNGDSARCLTQAQPSFAAPPSGCTGGCAGTPEAVAPETIQAALAPTDFITFGSGIVDQHSGSTTQGVLEAQPHNLVHNCVGGFMADFMSPVDPIFFMHHSNIERLWLVWTAKQEANGDPTLPTGDDLAKWSAEPFLFYIDADGNTLSTTAGDFSTVGSFDYTYTAGSGSMLAKAARRKVKSRSFENLSEIPRRLLEAAAREGGPELLARVPVDPQGRQKGKTFHVLIDPPEGTDPTDTSSPHHVAAVSFFGSGHGHDHGETGFVVPLNKALARLKAEGKLKAVKGAHLVVAVQDHREGTQGEAKRVRATVRSH